MRTLVFRYGLLRPDVDVIDELKRAHKYRCNLVAIERGRRHAIRELALRYNDLAALEKTARELEQGEFTAEETKDSRKTAKKAVYEARKTLRNLPEYVQGCAGIDEIAAALVRNAREYCGVYWGTYLLIEQEAQQARLSPFYDGLEPNDPHFPRWNGEGRLGVQVQGGMSVPHLVSDKDTRLRIAPGIKLKESTRPGGGKRTKQRRQLWFRIGSLEKGKPMWAKFPMMLHRDIPEGSRIKAAQVHRRLIGPQEEWYVTIICQVPAPPAKTETNPIAVDFGWRVKDDGLRVAFWRDTQGNTGEIRIDEKQISSLRYSETLRGIRDRAFNEAVGRLPKDGPEWFRKATETVGQWRSIARLVSLVRKWKTNRWEGDEADYEQLEAWRYKDHHLWVWESYQRVGSIRTRRERYRLIAAKLASKYGSLVIAQFDLREVAKVESTDNTTSRSNRQLAAVSELRMSLVHAFQSRGGAVHKVSDVNKTLTCSECLAVQKNWDRSKSGIEHTCEKCNARWDQDDNHTINLLREFDELKAKSPVSGESVPAKSSRWKRLKDAKQSTVAA